MKKRMREGAVKPAQEIFSAEFIAAFAATPYDKDRAERTTTTSAEFDSEFVQSMLAADASIFEDDDR